MNKIYQAFDSIKLDDKIKKKTYQILEEKHKKRVSTKFIYSLSLALTAITLFIAMSTYTAPQSNDDKGADTFVVTEAANTGSPDDAIMYNGQKYVINDLAAIDSIDIDKKLGVLKQVDNGNDLKIDFESYYHEGYEVYSSNKKDVLIVKFGSDVLVYIKQ